MVEKNGSIDSAQIGRNTATRAVRLGSQTLFRGLDVVEVVAQGSVSLNELARRLNLTRSTAHRVASALVDRRYLNFVPGLGYSLGPKLLELGYKVRDELDLPRLAAPHLERLAVATEDTIHLGVLDHDRVLYVDKIPGRRRISVSSRIGERQLVTASGLGQALIIDNDEESWIKLFLDDGGKGAIGIPVVDWLIRMRNFSHAGCIVDLGENGDDIRCVAAPVRDVEGRIIAAIDVSGAAQYMGDDRINVLSKMVIETANLISMDLGWTGARRLPKRTAKSIIAAADQRTAKSRSGAKKR